MIITGTNHFVSLAFAELYYKKLGFSASNVKRKVNAEEIAIGKPQTKPGEHLEVVQGEGRYSIVAK